ncbi:hypothetical protein [Sphingopyxis flava]|uniref:Uncharacterized protein n=1 Tax=Sphingopyxis flava TaxID=1507287 RepID=A0A1T5ABX7_9SPHN|nr:hypothetical protein [Sphingopyxis flava]SKB32430.1 hypothetical protein SAMN06295937_100378 [Sphingopyxis flava]
MTINSAITDPSDDADDFDKAFDEIASGDAPPADDAAGSDDQDPVSDTDPESPPPADDAAGQETQAAGQEAPPAKVEPSDDIWANASPELRTAHEQQVRDLTFKLESQKGRTSALDRKLDQLMKQLNGGQGGGGPAEATSDDGKGSESGAQTDEALTQFAEDYPEIAGPVLGIIEGLKAQVEQLSQPVQSLAEAQSQTFKAQQYDILAQRHPDWRELSTDERWGGWIQTQPRAVQEAFQRNIDVSDGEEAAWVMGLFKRDMGIEASSSPAPTPTPTPTPSPADTRRQKQLDAARDGGGNGGASVTNEIPDDFDAEFDRITALKQRRGSSR